MHKKSDRASLAAVILLGFAAGCQPSVLNGGVKAKTVDPAPPAPPAPPGPEGAGYGPGRMTTVKNILNAKCMTCHAARGDFPQDIGNVSQWQAQARTILVGTPNDRANSLMTIRLIAKLKLPGTTGTAEANMPQSPNPALSETEYFAIVDWVHMLDRPEDYYFQFTQANAINTPVGSPTEPIRGMLSKSLRVRNLTASTSGNQNLTIHTEGRPFDHTGDTPRGAFVEYTYDFTVDTRTPGNTTPANQATYNHNVGTSSRWYFLVE
jgi:hypothetical protein